jgi:hypothetical protein
MAEEKIEFTNYESHFLREMRKLRTHNFRPWRGLENNCFGWSIFLFFPFCFTSIQE